MVLAVDDEPAVLQLVKLIVEAAGYAVLAAHSGQQAPAFCENRYGAINVLLTDIDMPDISGPELICRVSEIAPHLPVIFMTACRVDTSGIECLRREKPFSDCELISKPFNSPARLGEVDRHCFNNSTLSAWGPVVLMIAGGLLDFAAAI